MGGVGNKLFQLNNSWNDPGTIYVDIDKFSPTIRRLIPIKQHLDWINVSNLIYEFNRVERRPNIFDLLFLTLIYIFRRVGERSDVCLFKRRLGYFQRRKVSHNFLSDFQTYCCKNCILRTDPIFVKGNNSLIVHARGLDFDRDIRLDTEILKSLNPQTKVYLVGDDMQFKLGITKDFDVKLVGGTIVDDFNTIANAQCLLASSSTFAFWASISKNPKKMKIHPKSGLIFKLHSELFQK